MSRVCTLTCDRCGKPARKGASELVLQQGIAALIGNSGAADLCRECIASFVVWFKDGAK